MTANLVRPPMARTLRQAILSISSASLLFSTILTPLAAQVPGIAPPPGAVAGQTANLYSAEELDAILAPIALYPDQLLTQVLMASAFPDQVAALENWLSAGGNGAARGEHLDQALRPMLWDPAVKSLAPFPQVAAMLASHAAWMGQLAFAVAEQEAATFDAIQRLRRQARLAGYLRTNSQQVVRMEGALITIVPVSTNVVYVPVYNPQVVYGTWGYPDYPPYYFPPAYVVPGNVLATGIFFGAGVAVIGSLWGWATPRWRDRNFYVDPRRYDYFRQNHHVPAGDWGRIDRNQWRPPVRGGDGGQVRPMPPRPADTQFRPPVQRPAEGQVRPMPPRPGDGRLRPGSVQPGDSRDRPLAPHPGQGQGQMRPVPGQPGDTQARPLPRRGQEHMRPVPGQPGAGQDPMTPSHQGQGRMRPTPGPTGDSQERPVPSRPAQQQMRPGPVQPGPARLGVGQPGVGQNPAATQRQQAPHGQDNNQVRPAPDNNGGGQGRSGPQGGGGGGGRPERPSESPDRSGDQRR